MNYDSQSFTTDISRRYTLFQPYIYLILSSNKRKGRKKQLSVNYGIYQWTPSLTSLVSILNTTNPLAIRLGNPDLQKQTEHSLRGEYTAQTDSIHQTVRLSIELKAKRNAFAQGYTYDSVTGIRTYRSENIKSGNWKLSSQMNYSRALGTRKLFRMENELRLSIEKSTDLAAVSGSTSTELSRVLSTYTRWKPRLRYQQGNLNCTLRGELAWQHLHRSLAVDGLPANIWSISYGLYAQYKLPLDFTIDTDFDLYHRRGYADAELNDNRIYWNASLTKSLLKGHWVLKLRAYDLLGQVSNLRYSINAQGRTEMWTNSMLRYVLFSVSYRFSQKPRKRE